jgi:hypothetical protein
MAVGRGNGVTPQQPRSVLSSGSYASPWVGRSPDLPPRCAR